MTVKSKKNSNKVSDKNNINNRSIINKRATKLIHLLTKSL